MVVLMVINSTSINKKRWWFSKFESKNQYINMDLFDFLKHPKTTIKNLVCDYLTANEQIYKFCINPDRKVFEQILNNDKVLHDKQGFIEYWITACIKKYGKLWQYSQSVIKRFELVDDEDMNKLIHTMFTKPTITAIKKVWMLFFATGEYKYIKMCLEAVGGPTTQNVKLFAMENYNTIIDMYLELQLDKPIETKKAEPFLSLNKLGILARKYGIHDKKTISAQLSIVEKMFEDSVKKYNSQEISGTAKTLFEEITNRVVGSINCKTLI
jgi:hypothetical protein